LRPAGRELPSAGLRCLNAFSTCPAKVLARVRRHHLPSLPTSHYRRNRINPKTLLTELVPSPSRRNIAATPSRSFVRPATCLCPVERHTHKFQIPGRDTSYKPHHVRHFSTAGRAPRRPEIEQHDLPAHLGQVNRRSHRPPCTSGRAAWFDQHPRAAAG